MIGIILVTNDSCLAFFKNAFFPFAFNQIKRSNFCYIIFINLVQKLTYKSLVLHGVCSNQILQIFNLYQGCRIPGSGGARAPPVFKIFKTLSHKNAIKPSKNTFYRGLCTPRNPRHPQFSRGCDSPEVC